MHHSPLKFRTIYWAAALIMALPLSAAAQAPGASATAPEAGSRRGGALVVPINGTQRLQMRTKKRITRVLNPKENVAKVQPIPGDPVSVLVTGVDAGITQVTLFDENGGQET